MPKMSARDATRHRAQDLTGAEFDGAIQDALATLADLDRRYEERRAAVDRWSDRHGGKRRLLQTIEAQHRRDREPLVQQLAQLHQRMMSATMFRTLH